MRKRTITFLQSWASSMLWHCLCYRVSPGFLLVLLLQSHWREQILDLREQPCLLSCMHHLRPSVECTGSYPGFLLVPCCYSLNHRHILCSLGIIVGHSASILLIVIMIFSQSGYYFKYLLISAFKTMLQCKKHSNSTSQHRFKK